MTMDIDGRKVTSAHAISWPQGEREDWGWTQHCSDGSLATLHVPEPGVYNIQVLMYDDGVCLDKIFLTKGCEKPRGLGPDESESI